MRFIRSMIGLGFTGLVLCGCGGEESDGIGESRTTGGMPAVEIEYNPTVESFTTGNIGRQEEVSVTLTEAVDPEAELGKRIEIEPKVKGSWSVDADDPRRIVFRPKNAFDRGTGYTVRVGVGQLLKEHPEAKDFRFSFRTLPAEAIAEMSAFRVEEDGSYSVEGILYTADTEDSAQIRRMTDWNGPTRSGSVRWSHSEDGRSHRFAVTGIEAGVLADKLTLTVRDKKAGYDKAEVLRVDLPGRGSFGLHSVAYRNDREQYIDVRFTRRLDPGQDPEGLVRLDGVRSVRQVEGNCVRIYPNTSALESDQQEGGISVTVTIDGSLRSADGERLSEDLTRTVVLDNGNPAVRFVGKGTVVPPQTIRIDRDGAGRKGRGVPFQAIGLRAVRVDVFRISERSVGQFLQENELDDNDGGNLMRTARPVATRTLFLDGGNSRRLRQWSTYSLDLDELIAPEPGALYRIALSFDRSMSALPCLPADERLTREAARQADRQRLRAMERQFDRGGYYWGGGDSYDWSVYEWKDRNNPCTPSYYFNRTVQRNLLASDLGVIAKGSDEPQMLFLVHSISTTDPVKEARIELRNYQGLAVGEGKTDDNGQALVRFTGGRPYYAVVSRGKERSYLKVNAGSELSTSTFDVSGEQVREGLRGFVWTERGVWRPGDTIHLNFVASGMRLPEGHPVTVELRSPLGQLYQKRVATRSVGGIYGFTLATAPEAPTGVWNATVSVGGATFGKRLRIETVKPNRLKIDLRFPGRYIERGKPMNALLHGEWLTGAKVGGLRYTIETELRALRSGFEGYPRYVFDNPYLDFGPERAPEITGQTDVAGDARITAVLNGGEHSGGMLQARLTTRLFEPSGSEASVDVTTMLYSPYDAYVGIRPPAGADEQLPTGQNHRFEIATVRPDGEPLGGRSVSVNVYRVEWHWWWSSERNELARYVSSHNLKPVRSERLESSTEGKTVYTLNLKNSEWGTYYITAKDLKSGHESAVLVYADWPDYGNRRHEGGEGAMRLAVSVDRKSYHAGDRATVSFPAVAGARAIVSVENGSRVVETFLLRCDRDGAVRHTFDVTPAMQPNVYLNVTLLQPYDTVKNDLPVRLYGIVPLTVTSAAGRLEPVIGAPAQVLPESELAVTVSEKNGRACAYTLALVDEGLLDLTRFRTPDPWEAFNARVALGVSTWDIYNNVLGAYGGRIEQMFAIGGDTELSPVGRPSVSRFPPVVRYVGTFELAKGEKATHKITLPAYMGRVRAMVVAAAPEADGGNGAWGAAERSITVRSPLMVLGSAPRAVAPGDEFEVPATLVATQERIGAVTAEITVDKRIFTVVGAARQTATLTTTGEQIVRFRLKVNESAAAGAAAGGHIELSASTATGRKSHYGMDVPLRRLSLPVAQGENHTVAPGETWNGQRPLVGLAGTQRLMLDVSSMEPIGAAQRMEYLSNYPYGCVEQITSSAFPLLYLPALTDLSADEQTEARATVEGVLERYKHYATPDGAMGYWPGSGSASSWGSAYALHFMAAAGQRGYSLPTGVYDRLQKAVKSAAVRWNASENEALNLIQAYQLYALALSGAPELGAMNRLRQSDRMTVETRWMLAAAYAAAGRTDMGRTVATGTVAAADSTQSAETLRRQRTATYGSAERALAVQLLAETLLGRQGEAAEQAKALSRKLASNAWMSTQTTAWSLVAMGEYATRNGRAERLDFAWSAADEKGSVTGEAGKTVWTKTWTNPSTGRLSVVNRTGGPLYIRTVASGVASGRDVPATRNGLEVTVRYTDGAGRTVDAGSLAQGTDFVAEVTVRNLTAEPLSDLMLSEPVASGWEIRPDSGREMPGVGYRDLRDDRADSFIPTLAPGGSVTVTTRLNATYAGRYTLPAIRCAAMYDDSVAGNTASTTATVY